MTETIDHTPTILIVEDEPAIRDLLSQMLSDEYDCVTAASAKDALEECQRARFDLVISDINLGGMTGVEMTPSILRVSPETVVMLISGAQSVDVAIDAMRVGVFDYVRKPFDYDQVLAAVRRALDHHASLVEKHRHASQLQTLVEQKSAELQHLTRHDPLTGLPNESLFEEMFREPVVSSATGLAGVMMIGISNLRSIRDTLGQDVADQIMLEVSVRLRALTAAKSLARVNGDRFAILLSSFGPQRSSRMASEIFDVLRRHIRTEGRDIHLHVNIGISLHAEQGTVQEDLLRNAGVALREAEEAGVGRHAFFASEMNQKAVRRFALESNLRRALERNELSLLYQPKIDVRTRQPLGMEALLRWNSGELGPVSPDVFIPVAESSELIVPIGEWVLRTACKQARVWHEQGFPLQVSVNLSPRQFQDEGLSNNIWNILDEAAIEPIFLNLEVTESSIMTDQEAAAEILTRLQSLGVRISVDDFGTGHSSFGYLHRLPIDVLKIDKTFVSSMTIDAHAATLVRTLITLAHDLRLKVVAEGVETEAQLEALRTLGCDEWQGFLHSRPLSVSDFEKGLRANWKIATSDN